MKQKIIKSVAVAAVIGALCITSVFAAINFDVLKEFFAGDSSLIKQFIKTPRASVSDGRFKLTLEEMLTDNYYIFMVYSLEGLTDDAISELLDSNDLIYDNNFRTKIFVSPSPGVSAGTSTAYHAHSREIQEKRTATTRYWVYYDEMDDVKSQPLRLHLKTSDDEQYIDVPTDSNVEVKELTLKGHPYGDAHVRLSPIGIAVDKVTKSGSGVDVAFNEVFFRMKNNEIKTYNQLASVFKGFMAAGEVYADEPNCRYLYCTRFLDVIPLSEFKSIILGNMEYNIDNPGKTNDVTLDEKMYPVEVNALLLESQAAWLPVEETCNKLGAEMIWNENTLSIKYRGETVQITDNSNTYVKSGRTVVYQMPQSSIFCTFEDKLMVNFSTLEECLSIGVYESGNIKYTETPIEGSVYGGTVMRPVTPQYTKYYIIP